MSATVDAASEQAPGTPQSQTNLIARAMARWRYLPHLIVFFSSASIMVVEITAGRLIGTHLGNSLYTWTSIIGVVLAGMSLGNYTGGRMADRWSPEHILGWLFFASSLACVGALGANALFVHGSPLSKLGLSFPVRVFCTVTLTFLVPSLILGTISPVTAKMALERSNKIGTTLGSISAWGTIGSICGTLSTGFWLISTFGARALVLFTALGLGVIGAALGPSRLVHLLWVALLGGCIGYAKFHDHDPENFPAQTFSYIFGLRMDIEPDLDYDGDNDKWSWSGKFATLEFARDSDYQFVKVSEVRSEWDSKQRLRSLVLDALVHGYADLKRPGHLEYEYERLYRDISLRYMWKKYPTIKNLAVKALFLGGGSYTIPRWVEYFWPGSDCLVAEIDPVVVEANYRALGLAGHDKDIRTVIGDARMVVDELPESERFDLIYGDAFNDFNAPWHLTTLEFCEKLNAHLAPGGVYLANVIDDWDYGLMLGAYVETMSHVFKHVYVFTTRRDQIKAGRETYVVAGSNTEMDFSDVTASGHLEDSMLEYEFYGLLFSPEDLAVLREKSGARVLTDDNAPVDLLIAPVARSR